MFDLIIIGAGPAGMAAASTAAKGGARVLVLDEQPRPGGQIYRDLGPSSADYLGADYAAGVPLIAGLDAPGITVEHNASVWRIDDGPRVVWSRDGSSQISAGKHLLLASGAQERPVPFPGWTLPGIMSAGAAQILMKGAGLIPRGAVLAGAGPLLYVIAVQMIDAGVPPLALVETQDAKTMVRAVRHLPEALAGAPTLLKGLGLLRRIRAAGVPRYTGAGAFQAVSTAAQDIRFQFNAKGRAHAITTPLLLIHQGVVPSTQISGALGLPHDWNAAQHAYLPRVGDCGATNLPHVHIAGDGAGIGGVEVAKVAGRLAARDILRVLGHMSEVAFDRACVQDRAALSRAMAVRPFLNAAYAPPPDTLAPKGDTIVCRCEEITAEAIRQSIDDGANGPRQIKIATRAGMGPCQGRMCQLAVDGILRTCGIDPMAARARTPIKPVTLGEIAALVPE